MKRQLPLLLLLLAFVSCRHDSLPEGVLDASVMTDFLTDAYIIEGSYAVETRYRYDTLPDQVLRSYDSILALHGVTREQVERSFDYYLQHIEAYQAIQDSVVARLETQNAAMKEE